MLLIKTMWNLILHRILCVFSTIKNGILCQFLCRISKALQCCKISFTEFWYRYFSLYSIVTMIGYGNTVPKTNAGKLAVIFYAMIGIPVYVFYLMNMGKIFARFLKWIYTKAYRWNVRRKWRNEVNYRPNHNGTVGQDLDEAYLDELEKQVQCSVHK